MGRRSICRITARSGRGGGGCHPGRAKNGDKRNPGGVCTRWGERERCCGWWSGSIGARPQNRSRWERKFIEQLREKSRDRTCPVTPSVAIRNELENTDWNKEKEKEKVQCDRPVKFGVFFSDEARSSYGSLRVPIFKNSAMKGEKNVKANYLRASSLWRRFQWSLQSCWLRANLPATVFQFGRALLSCFSWRSLAKSSSVHGLRKAEVDGDRDREICLASAARSRWLPVERRRRSGAGLGAGRMGDFDKAESGMGTSHAAGAWQWRTGDGRLALFWCRWKSGPGVVETVRVLHLHPRGKGRVQYPEHQVIRQDVGSRIDQGLHVQWVRPGQYWESL